MKDPLFALGVLIGAVCVGGLVYAAISGRGKNNGKGSGGRTGNWWD